MYSAKKTTLSAAVLLSSSIPLGCEADTGREGSPDDRQYAVCNERYEAENASEARDWTEEWKHIKQGSYMNAGGQGAAIVWDFYAPVAGDYQLLVRYANGDGQERDRPVDILVDDDWEGDMTFRATDEWSDWTTETQTIHLEEGRRRIQLVVLGSGGPNIDYIELSSDGMCS